MILLLTEVNQTMQSANPVFLFIKLIAYYCIDYWNINCSFRIVINLKYFIIIMIYCLNKYTI